METKLKSTDTAGLSRAFATEVAGYFVKCEYPNTDFPYTLWQGERRTHQTRFAHESGPLEHCDFCHSTDAILRHVAKAHSWRCETTQDGFTVRIRMTPESPNAYATGETLAMALVVGMLRAVGVEVET